MGVLFEGRLLQRRHLKCYVGALKLKLIDWLMAAVIISTQDI